MPETKRHQPEAGAPPIITKRAEQKQVEERVTISAHVVHETIRMEGEDELRRTAAALAWSGLAAGLSMGFSLVAEAVLAEGLPDSGWAQLISKLGYSVGFLIVVLGRQQLFTENTLTAVLPLLTRKNSITTIRVLRLWSIVLCANLVGTNAICVLYRAHQRSELPHAANRRAGQPACA